MVIISEVFSITEVVIRAHTLLSRVPEAWYRKGSEIQKFRSTLSSLLTSAQWERQLQQYGMGKEVPAYNDSLARALELLDAEKNYYEKNRKSLIRKFNKRPFPSQLTGILSKILELVQEGQKHLAESVEVEEKLTERLLTDPLPLPFGNDPKYVPQQETVRKVRMALDDSKGQQVVTLYGDPGMGKSSLAKHVAWLYQDLTGGSTSCPFDGVRYFLCGRGCGRNLHQLAKGFFSSLGFGAAFPSLISDEITEQIEEQNRNSSLCQNVLRRLLADKRLLIILDDVWEEDSQVLTNLISPETPCKYLLTSQTKNVWQRAKTIRIKRPTDEQAHEIFKNHLQGFVSSGRSSLRAANLEGEIRKMIKKLDNHPLSVVNVAVSMNQNGILDAMHWRSLVENIFTFLDDNYNSSRILVNERSYSHSVSASMMLMVESLDEAECDVLFLIALLQDIWGSRIPEQLVRFFMRRFYRDNPSESTSKYLQALQRLENNSLVQVERLHRDASSVDSVGTNRMELAIHKLRREFIIQKRLPALRIIASNLVAASGGERIDRTFVDVRDTDQCLAVVLCTMCIDDVLIEEVALPFQSVVTQMHEDGDQCGQEQAVDSLAVSGAVIPRGPLQRFLDVCEVVKAVKDRFLDERWQVVQAIGVMMELLNLEGEDWNQQVRSDASKIILKLVVKGLLDDVSMASLFRLPYTTKAAGQIFEYIYQGMYGENLEHLFNYRQRKLLSDTYPATWQILSNLGSTVVTKDCYLLESS